MGRGSGSLLVARQPLFSPFVYDSGAGVGISHHASACTSTSTSIRSDESGSAIAPGTSGLCTPVESSEWATEGMCTGWATVKSPNASDLHLVYIVAHSGKRTTRMLLLKGRFINGKGLFPPRCIVLTSAPFSALQLRLWSSSCAWIATRRSLSHWYPNHSHRQTLFQNHP
jgi:hypothetical protein